MSEKVKEIIESFENFLSASKSFVDILKIVDKQLDNDGISAQCLAQANRFVNLDLLRYKHKNDIEITTEEKENMIKETMQAVFSLVRE